MTIKQELLSILILIIIPIFLGHSFCVICKKKKAVPNYFMYGSMVLYAFIQFVSIPLIHFSKPFHLLYDWTMIFVVVFSIAGIVVRIVTKDFDKSETVDIKVMSILFIVATILLTATLLKTVYSYQHIDEDDSRFVVNSVDILESDSFFTLNPATGFSIEKYQMGDLEKDTVAPWAAYVALLSKFTGVSVVVMSHTVLPLALVLLAICTWWQFSGRVFDQNAVYQGMFTIMMILFLVYTSHENEHAIYSTLTKLVFRVWQGKAVLASIGIPMLFLNMFDYFEEQTIQNMVAILICNIGICLMSANAMYIGIAITGGFAFVYMILKKNILLFIKTIPLMIPNILYMVLYFVVKKAGF